LRDQHAPTCPAEGVGAEIADRAGGREEENADREMNGVRVGVAAAEDGGIEVLGTIAKPFDTDHWELYDVNNHAADSLPDTGDGNDTEQSGVSQ
jgi:hypothetical protein